MVRLRHEMQMTQAQFATHTGWSISMVTKLETVTPPRGNVLLKLAMIARKATEADLGDVAKGRRLVDLMHVFLKLNEAEVGREATDKLAAHEGADNFGYLAIALRGRASKKAAEDFKLVLAALESSSRKTRSAGLNAAKVLGSVAEQCQAALLRDKNAARLTVYEE